MTDQDTPVEATEPTPKKRRIPAIDLIRGLAIVAMVIFHFTFDLQQFEVLPRRYTQRFGWSLFSSGIAGSFIFLAGVSLFLAHHHGFKFKTYVKRTAMVGVAALLVTVVTYFTTPNRFIYFGILHCITFASVVGLVFLRLPWWIAVLSSVFFFTGDYYLGSEFLNRPFLWGLGLAKSVPRANDWVPVFPWFGCALVGIAVAKLVEKFGGFVALSKYPLDSRPLAVLRFMGRHSLIFYLVHQPVMIGILTAYFRFVRN